MIFLPAFGKTVCQPILQKRRCCLVCIRVKRKYSSSWTWANNVETTKTSTVSLQKYRRLKCIPIEEKRARPMWPKPMRSLRKEGNTMRCKARCRVLRTHTHTNPFVTRWNKCVLSSLFFFFLAIQFLHLHVRTCCHFLWQSELARVK